jgi:hypothetical protein
MILAVVLLLATVAWASARPNEIAGEIKASKPYGTASLTWLFLTAYDASLWTDAHQWSMDAPFALAVVYRMSFSREELVERTMEEMQRVAPDLNDSAIARFAPALAKAFPAVKDGDRITALHVPGAPVRFFHNGRPTHSVPDVDFAAPFFGIWLSPKTSEPSVRNGLLNLKR